METIDLFQTKSAKNIERGANESIKKTPMNIVKPYKSQLLKWVGNKQRQATDIIENFPEEFSVYYEPFLGSGGVLGVLAPEKAVASDVYQPLMEIWNTLKSDKEKLIEWYSERHLLIEKLGKKEAYDKVLDSFNKKPNGADFVFILRSCYGGVVRFRKSDGYMSTPCGAHNPISPESFSRRVSEWSIRVQGTNFLNSDYKDVMSLAGKGDLIYCDPPYIDSQKILYGAQNFNLAELFEKIKECKEKGIFVALSIDGSKLSGKHLCDVEIPRGVFEREVFVDVGGSMLKRFQVQGGDVKGHAVRDRLLLTY